MLLLGSACHVGRCLVLCWFQSVRADVQTQAEVFSVATVKQTSEVHAALIVHTYIHTVLQLRLSSGRLVK